MILKCGYLDMAIRDTVMEEVVVEGKFQSLGGNNCSGEIWDNGLIEYISRLGMDTKDMAMEAAEVDMAIKDTVTEEVAEGEFQSITWMN